MVTQSADIELRKVVVVNWTIIISDSPTTSVEPAEEHTEEERSGKNSQRNMKWSQEWAR
jgi:hypothetical protein